MKISGARVGSFLERPDPAVGFLLIYGPDRGLVSERARLAVRGTVGDERDPFLVTELTAAAIMGDPARLADASSTLSLGGGRRVVRIREATDALTSAFASAVEYGKGGALVVAEAGDLGKRSSLRRFFESQASAAAIACYGDDEGNLGKVIVETLGGRGLGVSAEAKAYLVDNLGGDRLVTRSELEKLALFMGGPGEVGLEDARAIVGDGAATSQDAVAFATGEGDHPALQRALDRAFQEGASAVGILRTTAAHFRRLHLAAGMMEQGKTADQAMAALKPPVFFKRKDGFRGQLHRWPPGRVGMAMEILVEAEVDCKTTGMPDEVVCGRVLMRLAQAARG